MAAAPAVPLVGGVEFGIGFAILAGLIVGIGLKLAYRYTLGALINALAKHLKIDAWRIHVNLAGPLNALNETIEDAIGKWILANEQALGMWFHANKLLAEWTYDALVEYARNVLGSFDGLIHGEIPAQVRAGTVPLTKDLGATKTAARTRDRAEAQARARGIAAEHDYVTGRAKVAERGIDDVRSTIRTHVIPRIRANERAIARERAYTHKGQARRLTRLEKLLGVGIISGIALRALTRAFPYWQCSNVRRFLRGVCRSPFGALDWLFALAALAVVALDPVRMLHLAEDAEDELEGIVRTMAGLPSE